MKNIQVSVIIPAYNEEKDIGECLKSLGEQSYKNFEIILIDDGSSDRTTEIARSFKNVKVIMGEHKGPGFSRNLGAKYAKGDILIFVDADMTFDKNYLKNLTKPILEDKTGKIVGTTHDYEVVKNISNIWSRCWGKIRVDLTGKSIGSIFRAMLKDKFIELGGFNPKYGYADDQTFWFKYKLRPIVAKKTVCYHKNPETLKEVYKQSRWIGASIDNTLLKIPIIRIFIPALLFLLFPLAIPALTINKAFKNRDLKILPQMLIFMFARYFGTISGLVRNIYSKNLTR